MARRRRTGAAEDIIDLTALLPWRAGVVLALVLYVVLHSLSAPVPTAGVQPGQIGGFMVRTMVATLAGIGQYLLPLLCLMGAAADGEKLLVQCKRWKAYKVGVSVVRELFGLMAAKGAAGGFVVTSGRFTQEAKDFAAGRNIQLVDGEALFASIQSVRKTGARPAVVQQGVRRVLLICLPTVWGGHGEAVRRAREQRRAGVLALFGVSGVPGDWAVKGIDETRAISTLAELGRLQPGI